MFDILSKEDKPKKARNNTYDIKNTRVKSQPNHDKRSVLVNWLFTEIDCFSKYDMLTLSHQERRMKKSAKERGTEEPTKEANEHTNWRIVVVPVDKTKYIRARALINFHEFIACRFIFLELCSKYVNENRNYQRKILQLWKDFHNIFDFSHFARQDFCSSTWKSNL